MIAAQTPSVEEFIAAYGDRCEYVQGERIEKALTTFQHGNIQLRLGKALLDYGQESGRGAPASEYHHRFGPAGDIRLYIPDIAFIAAPRHLDPPEYASSASELMVEILSPGDRAGELQDKIEFYLRNGVRSIWIVDPEKKRIGIYKPELPRRLVTADGVLADELLPGFALPLSQLFPQ